MSEQGAQPTHLTQADLETRWRLSGRTLERWRAEGYGPVWIVLGGSVRYLCADVEAFEARQRRGDQMSSAVRGKGDKP